MASLFGVNELFWVDAEVMERKILSVIYGIAEHKSLYFVEPLPLVGVVDNLNETEPNQGLPRKTGHDMFVNLT